jgi:hypothetical protein
MLDTTLKKKGCFCMRGEYSYADIAPEDLLAAKEKTLSALRKSLEERIKNFVATYEYEEWNTGAMVGSEVIH